MKRFMVCAVLACCLLGLCGCKKQGTPKSVEKEPDFVYPVNGVSAFCSDEQGNLYAYRKESGCIYVFDTDGVQIKSIPAKEKEYFTICYGNDTLYAVVSGEGEASYSSGICLVEVSVEDGSRKTLYENPDAWMAQMLTYGDGSLFFIEREVITLEKAELFNDPTGDYTYEGKRFMCYSGKTRSTEEIPVDRICAFTKKDETSLWVYAYDFECGKHYFAPYMTETGVVGEKSYVGELFRANLEEFAYDAERDKLLRMDIFKSCLVAMDPAELDNQSSFYTVDGVLDGIGIGCHEGRSYFLLNGEIHRVKNSNYIKDYEPLRIYYSTFMNEIPEGTGFEINMVEVDEETMAMMAGDSDYDFLLLSTDSPVAEQIRRVGAYEPLNSVPGVEEYLQGSFAYMQEAATDTNGAVWMLPYDISCDVLVYNPELCKKYGADFEADYSNEALWELQQALEEAEESGEPSYYSHSFSKDRIRVLESYLTNYAVVDGKAEFDTPLFRKYSEWYKKAYNRKNDRYYRYTEINPGASAPAYRATEEEIAAYFEEFLSQVAMVAVDKDRLAMQYRMTIDGDGYGYLDYDFFDVRVMPSLEENNPKRTNASAFILVLNPNSSHLKEAKEFLTVWMERLCAEESIYRTKELQGEYTALERKVHEIYKDARIVFPYPDDVFWEEYLKYLNGEKSLEETIPELERKLNLYLKE